MEKGEKNLMKRPPRKSSDGIFAGGVGFDVVYQGLFVTLLTLAAYFIGHFMEAGRWELTESALVIEVPFLADAFDFTTIDAREFFTALGLAFLIIPLVEIVKAIERAVIKNKAKKQTVK